MVDVMKTLNRDVDRIGHNIERIELLLARMKDKDLLIARIIKLEDALKQYANHANWGEASGLYVDPEQTQDLWHGTPGNGNELAEEALKEG